MPSNLVPQQVLSGIEFPLIFYALRISRMPKHYPAVRLRHVDVGQSCPVLAFVASPMNISPVAHSSNETSEPIAAVNPCLDVTNLVGRRSPAAGRRARC